MKKVVTLLAALLLGTVVSTPVYAEADADVWCETNVGQDNAVSVSVETNGKATDGVVVIGYDPTVVSCTEADVKIADSVDMYSVNVVDESVRISFLAEDAVKEGAIAEIAFEAADKTADKNTLESAISFTGEAYSGSGEALAVKTAEEEKPGGTDGDKTETGDKPQTGDKDKGQQNGAGVTAGNISTSTAAQSVNTGDTAEFTYLILLLAAGTLLSAAAAAGIGRKLNHKEEKSV